MAAICLLRGGLVYILDGAAPIHGISSGDFHCCLSENEHTRNNYQTHCFVLSATVELLHTERNRAYKVPIFRVFWNFHDRYVRTYAVSLRLTADEIQ